MPFNNSSRWIDPEGRIWDISSTTNHFDTWKLFMHTRNGQQDGYDERLYYEDGDRDSVVTRAENLRNYFNALNAS